MVSKYLIKCELDYLSGYLRYGHKEIEVDKSEWDNMTKGEQINLIKQDGELILDDYEVEGWALNEYGITKEEL